MAAPTGPRYDVLHPPLNDLVPPSVQVEQRVASRQQSASHLSSSLQPSQVYIVAIAESRLKEIGLAALSMRGAELILHQFVDSATCSFTFSSSVSTHILDLQLLTKLQLYEPVEVLIPSGCNELNLVVKNNLAETEIAILARNYFNESRGDSLIKALAHNEKVIAFVIVC